MNICTSASGNAALCTNFESSMEETELLHSQPDLETEEPWMSILVEELGKSFREFAKESGRLSRLVQPKRGCCIPSEGFNLQLAMRMEKVDRAFHTYMRRKEELLSYILATTSQAQRKGGTAVARLELEDPVALNNAG
jgi:hypothetical protein